MLTQLLISRGDNKRYTTEFTPAEKSSSPLLDGLFPDSEWLLELPFDKVLLTLFVSDRPLQGDHIAIELPPIPFAQSTKNKTQFAMLNDRGRKLRSSREYPVTQIYLYNAAIDASIIAEQKPIFSNIFPYRHIMPKIISPAGIHLNEATGGSSDSY